MIVRIEEYAFDYLLYPLMLYQGGSAILAAFARAGRYPVPSDAAGYWFGFALLLLASTGLNLLYIRLYDRSRTDWFGVEALKEAIDRHARRSVRWRPLRTPARYCAFVYLSIWHSPLFGTLFMRGSSQQYAMTPRDWRVFWIALIAANFGWTGLVTAAVEIIRVLSPHHL